MQLSKSDFLHYLACEKAFWLSRHEPDCFDEQEPPEFAQLLMAGGYEVEAVVRDVMAARSSADTAPDFQVEFRTDSGLYARADMVFHNPDGSIDLWEIKSSTGLRSNGADHVTDAAFQTIVAERSGRTVNRIGVVHVNGDYIMSEPFDPEAFLVFADVTGAVRDCLASTAADVDRAVALLEQPDIDRNGCGCRLLPRKQHCTAFGILNPDVPTPSVHDIPRLSAKKREAFVAAGTLGLDEINLDGLSAIQSAVVKAAQNGTAEINSEGVAAFLDGLVYPLYFYDYETFGAALPISSGLRPHEQIPVQISLHIVESDGTTGHEEHLTERAGAHGEIAEFLVRHIGPKGNLVCWNAPFEKSCNRRLARLVPHHADFLEALNERTVDLMEIFKQDYVDPSFCGSTSIKRALPVLVPDLQYTEEAVHDGTGAMQAWRRLIETEDPEEARRLRKELLAYCELDTLAMVRIFEFLRAHIN